MNTIPWTSALVDRTPSAETFLGDVLEGLDRQPRHLPTMYLYDERGSRLFDEICTLEEYYPTRTEFAIMHRYVGQMSALIGPGAMVVEFGSGSSMKTRILLERLCDPVAYVPVDISREHLLSTSRRIAADYPELEVLPVCADFLGELHLPSPAGRPARRIVYFPGSTIGNLHGDAACRTLAQISEMCLPVGGLLVGIDLQKAPSLLEAAYNDRKGVTAEFNLNLLHRINRELDGDFDTAAFQHRAVYNRDAGRIELYLVSRRRQKVTLGGRSFELESGESICTEYSYKYTIRGFAAMAWQAGLELRRAWTDDRNHFAVLYLAAERQA
ncbi:MAG: L-histidine N(alpha)-methyltransferase [Thermoguttaceae bacterium]